MLDALSGVAQSAHKMATDLRLLASRKELEEPFEEKQIGSSAMAYKRNPMRSERICSLARFVISLQSSTANTVATQWLERTLDDSANRRLVLPQAFLAVDAILILYQNVASGLVGLSASDRPAPAGGTALHGHREHPDGGRGGRRRPAGTCTSGSGSTARRRRRWSSWKAGRNDLLERLAADPAFAKVDLGAPPGPGPVRRPRPQQVDEFLAEVVAPIRARYRAQPALAAEVNV